VAEGGIAEVLDVVKQIAGQVVWALTTVPWKPKSLSSWEIFLSTGVRLMGNDRTDVDGLGAVVGEDAAVDVVFGGGWIFCSSR